MTLSSWLRDYLYIPLGGNRGGRAATYRNLLLTMLLGGLWHGAAWTFVAWGAYHGLLLALHRALPWPRWLGAPALAPLRVAFTFLCVMLGWVLFRARSLGDAGVVLGRLFAPTRGARARAGDAGRARGRRRGRVRGAPRRALRRRGGARAPRAGAARGGRARARDPRGAAAGARRRRRVHLLPVLERERMQRTEPDPDPRARAAGARARGGARAGGTARCRPRARPRAARGALRRRGPRAGGGARAEPRAGRRPARQLALRERARPGAHRGGAARAPRRARAGGRERWRWTAAISSRPSAFSATCSRAACARAWRSIELTPEWLRRPVPFLNAQLVRAFDWSDVRRWLPELVVETRGTLVRARLFPVYHYRLELLSLVGRAAAALSRMRRARARAGEAARARRSRGRHAALGQAARSTTR